RCHLRQCDSSPLPPPRGVGMAVTRLSAIPDTRACPPAVWGLACPVCPRFPTPGAARAGVGFGGYPPVRGSPHLELHARVWGLAVTRLSAIPHTWSRARRCGVWRSPVRPRFPTAVAARAGVGFGGAPCVRDSPHPRLPAGVWG